MRQPDPDGSESRHYPLFIDARPRPFRMRVVPEIKASNIHIDWILNAKFSSNLSDEDEDEDEEEEEEDDIDDSNDGDDSRGVGPLPPRHNVIGIQVAFTKSGALAAFALCVSDRILVITEVLKDKDHANANPKRGKGKNINAKPAQRVNEFRLAFREKLLQEPFYFVAFEAHEVALAIHKDTGLAFSRLFQLLDHPSPSCQKPEVIKTVKSAFGMDVPLLEDHIGKAFVRREFANGKTGQSHAADLAQEAWLAFAVGNKLYETGELFKIAPIDTSVLDDMTLAHLACDMVGLVIQEMTAPTERTVNLHSANFKGGRADVQQKAYNSRFHRSANQVIEARTADNVGFSARLGRIDGKQATLRVAQMDLLRDPKIASFRIKGKEDPTQEMAQRRRGTLDTLQKKRSLHDNKWYTILFPPDPSKSISVRQKRNVEADVTVTTTEMGLDMSSPSTSSGMDDSENSECATTTTETENEGDSYWKGWGDDDSSGLKGWDNDAKTPEPAISAALSSQFPNSRKDTGWDADESLKGMSWDDIVAEGDEVATDKGWNSTARSLWDDGIYETASPPTGPPREKGSKQKQRRLPKPKISYDGPLNESQLAAVKDMLDIDKSITIIKGPPGTGKTTVIAAVVSSLLAHSKHKYTGYIVTQSNVGAKNIAEKLVKAGISDWVLLVAAEYMKGWHEHLYQDIPKEHIVTSNNFKRIPTCRFILCTTSMLSNPHITQYSLSTQMQYLIVDEASQISMANYNPIIMTYPDQLLKVCFIGDNRQLPPYGSDVSDVFDSVFEHKALLLKTPIILLNKQYRMPPPIGDFISKHVYEGQLGSWEDHPVRSETSCQFIDVADGVEKPDGTSYKNELEAVTAVKVAAALEEADKAFKIITPYDAQRNLIEKKLQASDLPWENTVFNVDSFQGNEEDYIILSSVRTREPGFMVDLRRSNVMLSRAKKGMYICTNIGFLESVRGKNTLLGEMGRVWAKSDGGVVRVENIPDCLDI